MKLNDLAVIIVLFIVISFILLVFDIIPVAMTDVLAYSLLVIGIALVYTETIRQNRLSVFIGSIIFLFGVYFLITENFSLNISDNFYIPIILIFGGSGLLIIYISTAAQKIFFYLSLIFLSAGITLIITNSHWKLSAFFNSILPILNFVWPVVLIILILVIIMKEK